MMKKIVDNDMAVCYNERMKARVKSAYTKEEAEKYKQIILYAIKSGADKDGNIAKTKLAKQVYLADFIWFYENYVSMSGMDYRKRDRGPVADVFFRILDEMEDDDTVRCERIGNNVNDKEKHLYSINNLDVNFDRLSAEEQDLIKQIGEAWLPMRAGEIIDFTHEQMPYKICRDGEIIPYSLITQEDPSNVYGPVQLLRNV